jgi:hypothetical protein
MHNLEAPGISAGTFLRKQKCFAGLWSICTYNVSLSRSTLPLHTHSRASLIRTNWDSFMFGFVNFRINQVSQNTRWGGGIGDSHALSSAATEVISH